MANRRQFLHTGLAGVALLATAQRMAPAWAAPAEGLHVLDGAAAAIVAVLAPVVLDGVLPRDAAARARALHGIVVEFDRAVSLMSPAIRAEVRGLFSALAFAPTRVAMAGLWMPLPQASHDDIAAFLARWRHSRFDIQRSAYQALTQLVQAAWFGDPAAWSGMGYPGPPALP